MASGAPVWRAQGRRARLELKYFARHMMTEAVLHPDEIQGWRGEIHDGEVVKDDETARREEQEREEERRRSHGEQHGAPRRREQPRHAARKAA